MQEGHRFLVAPTSGHSVHQLINPTCSLAQGHVFQILGILKIEQAQDVKSHTKKKEACFLQALARRIKMYQEIPSMALASRKTVGICWHRGGSVPSLLECQGWGEECQHVG